MDAIDVAAMLVSLAAVLAYLNHRFFKLPPSIGLMASSLALSLGVLAVGAFAPAIPAVAERVLRGANLTETLFDGMLSFLLFAGALHVDLGDLKRQAPVIALLATVGVCISTVVVAFGTWLVAVQLLGLPLEPVHCLLFGAIVAPTDPIAVLAILRTLGAPRPIATKIAGESLFNDGVGVVVFLGLLAAAGLTGHGEPTVGGLAWLFVHEALGGVVFGFLLGWIVYRLISTVDHHHVEVLLTLAFVFGGHALAGVLHVSGPLAMVVGGLLLGNHGRTFGMSDATRERLDNFWELVDETLNAVLFVFLGLEVLLLTFEGRYVVAGLLAIPVSLLARWLAVGIPMTLLGRRRTSPTPHAVKVLTWGGLRGGISVALALWLSALLVDDAVVRDAIVLMTYAVVAFSVLVQGLTVGPLLSRLGLRGPGFEPSDDDDAEQPAGAH